MHNISLFRRHFTNQGELQESKYERRITVTRGICRQGPFIKQQVNKGLQFLCGASLAILFLFTLSHRERHEAGGGGSGGGGDGRQGPGLQSVHSPAAINNRVALKQEGTHRLKKVENILIYSLCSEDYLKVNITNALL